MDYKTLGEILHEAREAGNDGRTRPLTPKPWADRDPRLNALDEEMAAAVAAAVMERSGARLAEVRQSAVRFRSHYAGVLHPQAEALYHAILQVIDREPVERSDEMGTGDG